jgi:hypothetical protein
MGYRIKAKSGMGLKANVDIIVTGKDGRIEDYHYHNLAVSAGKNMLRDVLSGDETAGRASYLAWGTDTTAANAADTALGTETGRKAVTKHTDGATGVVVITTIILATEAVGVSIGEFGLFGGAATGTADSGTLIARVVWSPAHAKTDQESVQVDWTLTVS